MLEFPIEALLNLMDLLLQNVGHTIFDLISIRDIASLAMSAMSIRHLIKRYVRTLRENKLTYVPLNIFSQLPNLRCADGAIFTTATLHDITAAPPFVNTLLLISSIDEIDALEILLSSRNIVVDISEIPLTSFISKWLSRKSKHQLRIWNQGTIIVINYNRIYITKISYDNYCELVKLPGIILDTFNDIIDPDWQARLEQCSLGLVDPQKPPSKDNGLLSDVVRGTSWVSNYFIDVVALFNSRAVVGVSARQVIIVDSTHPLVREYLCLDVNSHSPLYVHKYIPISCVRSPSVRPDLVSLFKLKPIRKWPVNAIADAIAAYTNEFAWYDNNGKQHYLRVI